MKNALIGIPILLAACAGAGSMHYGPGDHRRSVTADLGTTFYVELPDTVRGKPQFLPGLLTLGADRIDETTHRRTLEFTAAALGETDLRIGSDFSLHVQVTSASDRPSMHVNH